MSAQSPLPVAVYRPRVTGPRAVAEILVSAAGLALRAWILMVVLGHFGLSQFGFWDAVLGCVGFRALRGLQGDYLSWTHLPGTRR